ncbi:MAG: LysR family transcriptional regulator [Castellaniella sp.]
MDAHRLKCFVAVVEAGNLSRAAVQLHMTQPPLSILIRKLESELNVDLFHRRRNRLVLTSAGALFYQRARELLASMQAVRDELKQANEGLHGTVTIGCATAASLFVIPEVVARLQDEGRNIVVKVREGSTSYVVEQLHAQQLDLGICRSEYTDTDLMAVALQSEPLLLAVPPGHRLLDHPKPTLPDLRNERFLMHSPPIGGGISTLLIQSCQSLGFSPNVVYWGIETLPLLLMVQRGLGIAFVPQSFEQLALPGLPRLIRIAEPQLETRFTLLTQKDRLQSALVRRFLEITRDVVNGL